MKKFHLFIFSLFFYSALTHGQGDTASLSKQEIQKIKKQADTYFELGDYNAAWHEYSLLLKYYPHSPEIHYKYGSCIIHANYHKEQAIPYFESAISEGYIEAYKMLGLTYHEIYQFDDALKYYNLYISKCDTNSRKFKNSDIRQLIRNTYNAKELVDLPIEVTIENIGPNINSKYADYVPIVTADDQEIFFTSRRANSTGGNLDHNKEFFEDIFYSEKDSGSAWSAAHHLSENLNSHQHDAVAGLSADGQTLLIYRNDPDNHGGDLFVSYLKDTAWTEPKKLGPEISKINTWEPSASLTANEDALFFTSDRPGGYGGRDLYVAKRQNNGSWGDPVNLGPGINTEYDEDAPFIHPDGKTLYFSSRGHKNMGGFDVFKSERTDKGEWGNPVNLGFPINTTDDDIYFTISADDRHGYYSSLGEDSYGEKDIYMIKFKPKEKSLAVLKGNVTDYKTQKPLAAQIFVNKTNTSKLFGIYNSNAIHGKYLIVLYPGFSYRAIFKHEGYRPDTLIVNAEEIDSFNEVVKNIRLIKTEQQLEDTVRPISKEVLVLHKKEHTPIATVDPPELASVSIATVHILVDTNGKQEIVAIQKRDTLQQSKATSLDIHNEKKEIKGAVTKSSLSKFRKDCQIDFSDSVHIMSFNFGYKLNDLKPEQYVVLDSVLKPVIKRLVGIKINTHTDNIGSERYNTILSQKRAVSIANHFKKQGIPSKKIVACYYGKSRPMVPNTYPDGTDNPDGRHKNRRAEIEFFIME